MRVAPLLLLYTLSCYGARHVPTPVPDAAAPRLDLAVRWVAATLDSTEGRGRRDPRLLAAVGPSPREGYVHPIEHDAPWLASRASALHLAGVCRPPVTSCFPIGGFLITVGYPDPLAGDTSYIEVRFTYYAAGIVCRPAPGVSAFGPRTTQPFMVYSHSWPLRLQRTSGDQWFVADSSTILFAHSYSDPCHDAV
jgi:hypothetical protein